MVTQSSFSSWALCFLRWVCFSLSLYPLTRIQYLPNLLTAVAARFGIGKDFWLNLLLTICGYIPGKSFSYSSFCVINLTTL